MPVYEWRVPLEGRSKVFETVDLTVSIPFRIDVLLEDFSIDGEGFVVVSLPCALSLYMYSDGVLELRYRDLYGREKRASLGSYSPSTSMSLSYRVEAPPGRGVVDIVVDGREYVFDDALPVYDKHVLHRFLIASVYTGTSFPQEYFFKLHGSITLRIYTEEAVTPPEEVPTPTPPPEEVAPPEEMVPEEEEITPKPSEKPSIPSWIIPVAVIGIAYILSKKK